MVTEVGSAQLRSTMMVSVTATKNLMIKFCVNQFVPHLTANNQCQVKTTKKFTGLKQERSAITRL